MPRKELVTMKKNHWPVSICLFIILNLIIAHSAYAKVDDVKPVTEKTFFQKFFDPVLKFFGFKKEAVAPVEIKEILTDKHTYEPGESVLISVEVTGTPTKTIAAILNERGTIIAKEEMILNPNTQRLEAALIAPKEGVRIQITAATPTTTLSQDIVFKILLPEPLPLDIPHETQLPREPSPEEDTPPQSGQPEENVVPIDSLPRGQPFGSAMADNDVSRSGFDDETPLEAVPPPTDEGYLDPEQLCAADVFQRCLDTPGAQKCQEVIDCLQPLSEDQENEILACYGKHPPFQESILTECLGQPPAVQDAAQQQGRADQERGSSPVENRSIRTIAQHISPRQRDQVGKVIRRSSQSRLHPSQLNTSFIGQNAISPRLSQPRLKNIQVNEIMACVDRDHDGYGQGCTKGLDCDDTNARVNPSVTERCDTQADDNCNKKINENCPPAKLKGAKITQSIPPLKPSLRIR